MTILKRNSKLRTQFQKERVAIIKRNIVRVARRRRTKFDASSSRKKEDNQADGGRIERPRALVPIKERLWNLKSTGVAMPKRSSSTVGITVPPLAIAELRSQDMKFFTRRIKA